MTFLLHLVSPLQPSVNKIDTPQKEDQYYFDHRARVRMPAFLRRGATRPSRSV